MHRADELTKSSYKPRSAVGFVDGHQAISIILKYEAAAAGSHDCDSSEDPLFFTEDANVVKLMPSSLVLRMRA